MLIQPTGWLIELVRKLLAEIDVLLFKILSYIIQLIFDIASFSLTSSETLKMIYKKLFVVLTVYMLFKLTFTFLNYIVNPEALSDDKQGVNKIIKNSVIMIILLIVLPGIFNGTILGKGSNNLIVRIQNAAIPLLSNILLPETYGEKVEVDENGNIKSVSESNSETSTSQKMALAIAKVFYHPAYKTYNEICTNKSKDEQVKPIETFDDLKATIEYECKQANNNNDYEEKTFYTYSYIYLIGTIVTCFLIYLLIKMVVLVGKRTFKLIVLEIIFPIPVIMLIDPKALDDSKSPFNAWLHTFISTFLELYFQLGTLYLFLNLINMVISAIDNMGIGSVDNLLLELVIIVSLVQFVGEAPAFIKKALGVKEDKSPSDEMGTIIAGAAGFAIGKAEGAAKAGATAVGKGAVGAAKGVGKGVLNTGKTLASTITSGIASSRHGQSFGAGASAGFKRSVGLDPNKNMKENIKENIKNSTGYDFDKTLKDNIKYKAKNAFYNTTMGQAYKNERDRST